MRQPIFLISFCLVLWDGCSNNSNENTRPEVADTGGGSTASDQPVGTDIAKSENSTDDNTKTHDIDEISDHAESADTKADEESGGASNSESDDDDTENHIVTSKNPDSNNDSDEGGGDSHDDNADSDGMNNSNSDTDIDSATDTDADSDSDSVPLHNTDTDFDSEDESDDETSDDTTNNDVDTGEPVAAGLETECNGIDDDGNGIVDDVDIGKDGVCDCLRITTIGGVGGWGDGGIFADWLESRSQTPATHLGHMNLTEEALGDAQILVIMDVQNDKSYQPGIPEAEAQTLYDWVNNGGSVMTLIGYTGGYSEEKDHVNEMLTHFDIGYGGEDILLSGTEGTASVTEFNSHVITRGVEAVGVQVGKPILGENGDVIATAEEAAVGQALKVGEGRLFMWGDEWITYDSEWSADQHPEYQVEQFWLNIFKWLSPPDECQVPIVIVK